MGWTGRSVVSLASRVQNTDAYPALLDASVAYLEYLIND